MVYPTTLVGGRKPLTFKQEMLKMFGSNLLALWYMNEGSNAQRFLTFNGSSTKIVVSDDSVIQDLPDIGDMTIDFWIRVVDPSDAQHIFHKGEGLTGSGWAMYTSASKLRFFMNNDGGDVSIVGPDVLPTNEFVHIACFWDYSEQKCCVAQAGVWGGYSALATGNYQSDVGYDMEIGEIVSNLEGDFGWIRISTGDRFGFGVDFTGSVPQRETVPTVDANTRWLWGADEGYGDVAGDLSGNGNHGTIYNGNWGDYPEVKDYSGNNFNGEYIGQRLYDMAYPAKVWKFSPFSDGVTDYINLYSPEFASAFLGNEFTLNFLFKPYGVDYWSDGIDRSLLYWLADSNNFIRIYGGGTNTMIFRVKAGGVQKLYSYPTSSPTNWQMITITHSEASDSEKYFFQGNQVGTTQTGLGTWSGSPLFSYCTFMAQNNASNEPVRGWGGIMLYATKAATDEEVQYISELLGVI